MARLDAAGFSNSPVRDLAEAAAEPQMEAVGAVLRVPTERLGEVQLVASPLHFSTSPVPPATPPPALGSDTREVLAQLGYSAAEIAELESSRAVGR